MEEDKKKKKNKKKKNKQATKPTENVTLDARESASGSQGHVSYIGQENGQVSRTIENDTGGHIVVDRDEHLANGLEGTNLAKAEKQSWLDKEASFQEKIKELQAEKNAQTKKEALLKEKINQLLNEKDENSQKEASQKEEIKQLHIEKNASMQNEASLKGKIIQLEKEKNIIIQKEGCREQKIQRLQREMDAHLQKEAGLEEKIDRLVEEAAFLNLKGVSLQEKLRRLEKERDSLILKENSAKESITRLTSDNTNLQAQVTELELSREGLLKEKQQLTEIVSSLKLEINNLKNAAGFPQSSENNKATCEDGGVNYQIEAARALVEKLISENSELVVKVNELYAELDRSGARTEYVFSTGSVPGAQSADIAGGSVLKPDWAVGADDRHRTAQVTDSIYDATQMMPFSGSNQSLEDIMIEDQRNSKHVNQNGDSELAKFVEISEADEIVQIPLDENEVRETNIEVAQLDEEIDVPLTDAPLIGAPFRLISFVARYVSGADLVNRST
ncbi:uncharacterized protein LOC105174685 isoform X3 [Sesamum indicum]|uniref:Uncharacterized protein LOC105174685 isoform X3 n=1 Tax=Sesamum indicum TaxID=4182 RepID=A0A8M8V3W6_SESIN|nr:uncharacterized protein LOC105174685 isoform X3 [Sesamum indicum]